MSLQLYQESFQKIERYEIEKMAGGKKAFRCAKSVVVLLPDGRTCEISLSWFPSNIPGGKHKELLCPACGLRVRVLRIVPGEPALACHRCVRKRFGAIYRCQEKIKKSPLGLPI